MGITPWVDKRARGSSDEKWTFPVAAPLFLGSRDGSKPAWKSPEAECASAERLFLRPAVLTPEFRQATLGQIVGRSASFDSLMLGTAPVGGGAGGRSIAEARIGVGHHVK